MRVWRYVAAPLDQPQSDSRTTGELAGVTAADVRASLRRAGLQALDVRPLRQRDGISRQSTQRAFEPIQKVIECHLRTRRRPLVGEVFDSLATMLEAGMPLLSAVEAVIGCWSRRGGSRRRMLLELRESLRGGGSLSQAMAGRSGWFDATDVAMVAAGQHSGNLSDVLRQLAIRRGRANELASKVVSALSYPFIVLIVGLGVVAFLSAKVLPDLTVILMDAEIEVPHLTKVVMAFGQTMIQIGPLMVFAIALLGFVGLVAIPFLRSKAGLCLAWPAWGTLRVLRQVKTAQAFSGLAEMTRVGVPVVDSLRVLAPTIGGFGGAYLGRILINAAERVEGGGAVAESLDDARWFDDETRRLIEIGETSGELPEILDRIANRQHRAATRAIDQLVNLLEPAMILLLAALVGLVVMAAILPLIRLQEVL